MKQYDYKPRFSIQFQQSISGERLIHIPRFEWTEGDVTEGEIISFKNKTYRKVSLASYRRVALLVDRLSTAGMGRVKVWFTSPGWEYCSFGKES